ncbi:MAG TPA: FAD-dependent oxidoreductase, partial [Vicinamibacteria bacterium]|nr:FAD-dependent oxidoreductase [Vicinamibacteria bacterium]
MANGEIYDVTVIGTGPGGYVAAIRAAQAGLKTAIVERDPAGCGGTCLQRGCIPTKALLHTADLYEDLKHAKEYGIVAEGVGLDFPAVMARKDRIVLRLAKGIETYLFKKNKVTLFKGHGRLEGAKTVVVQGEGGET